MELTPFAIFVSFFSAGAESAVGGRAGAAASRETVGDGRRKQTSLCAQQGMSFFCSPSANNFIASSNYLYFEQHENGADDEAQLHQAQHLVQEVDRVRDWLTAPAHSSTRAAGPFGTGGVENVDFFDDEGLSGAEREMLRRNRARYHEELYREQQQRERREREEREQQRRADEEYKQSHREVSRSTSRSRKDRDRDAVVREERGRDVHRGNSRDRHHREGSRHRSESRERNREPGRDKKDKNKRRDPTLRGADERMSRDSTANRYRSSYQSDEEENEEEEEYSPEEENTRSKRYKDKPGKSRSYDPRESYEVSDSSPAETTAAGITKEPEQYNSAGHRVWGSGIGSGTGNKTRYI